MQLLSYDGSMVNFETSQEDSVHTYESVGVCKILGQSRDWAVIYRPGRKVLISRLRKNFAQKFTFIGPNLFQ